MMMPVVSNRGRDTLNPQGRFPTEHERRHTCLANVSLDGNKKLERSSPSVPRCGDDSRLSGADVRLGSDVCAYHYGNSGATSLPMNYPEHKL